MVCSTLKECKGHLVCPGTDWHVAVIDALLERVVRLTTQKLPGCEPGTACRKLGQLVQVEQLEHSGHSSSLQKLFLQI